MNKRPTTWHSPPVGEQVEIGSLCLLPLLHQGSVRWVWEYGGADQRGRECDSSRNIPCN